MSTRVFPNGLTLNGFVMSKSSPNATQSETFESYVPQGAGSKAVGGYTEHAAICKVTSLSDDEKDTQSLRYFLTKTKGARFIYFGVSGIITLTSPLKVTDGNFTIDGSAIFDKNNKLIKGASGITLMGYPIKISDGSDFIIRYLRFRLGNQNASWINNNSDCLAVGPASEGNSAVSNFVLDHLSFAWSLDELVSTDGVKNGTIQYCIMGEALSCAGHPEGEHSKAALLSVASDSLVSVHHCLFAHNRDRNPRLNTGTLDIRYNVMYNCGEHYTGRSSDSESADKTPPTQQANFYANYVLPGTDSEPTKRLARYSDDPLDEHFNFFAILNSSVRLWLLRNKMYKDDYGSHYNGHRIYWKATGNNDGYMPQTVLGNEIGLASWAQVEDSNDDKKDKTGISSSNFDTFSKAMDAMKNDVLKSVGYNATQISQDEVDKRIIQTIADKNGRIIDNPMQVGGYSGNKVVAMIVQKGLRANGQKTSEADPLSKKLNYNDDKNNEWNENKGYALDASSEKEDIFVQKIDLSKESQQWILESDHTKFYEPNINQIYYLKSVKTGKYLNADSYGNLYLNAKEDKDAFKWVFQAGKTLCFFANIKHIDQYGCRLDGTYYITNKGRAASNALTAITPVTGSDTGVIATASGTLDASFVNDCSTTETNANPEGCPTGAGGCDKPTNYDSQQRWRVYFVNKVS
ncbi:MAG: hypothetical protein RLZZ628_2126 [Bacteroidota bacterium]|jgi:hypothetical protein